MFFDINKSIKEQGIWKTFIILVLVLIIGMGSGYYLCIYININSTIQQDNKNSASVSQQFISGVEKRPQNNTDNTNEIVKANNNKCTEGKFEEKIDDWEITQYAKPDEEGFYCPRSWSSFSSPDIWYKKDIPTKFESIEIKYRIKSKNSTTPSFIFSIGKGLRILRIYIPEKNPQLVGFENISMTDSNLERVEPRQLEKGPIKYGPEVNMKVQPIINEGNKATYTFNLKYISDTIGESVETSLRYDVSLPDPEPQSQYSVQHIGLGTFKGNCIKPISYQL